MGKLSVDLCGITLDNPVIPASGTFGFGYEYAEYYDINVLGTFSFKGTTLEERFGNPTPRIAECNAGLINAVGLQNPGIHKVIAEELPKLKKVFNKPVMANVGGFSVSDYVTVCQMLDKEEQVGWLEVNISCPNVHAGGVNFGSDPKGAYEVISAVKKAVRKPVIANTMGGYSGPAVFPVAVRMVYQVAKAVNIPVIGLGGISNAEDALEMMMAGATAVQVGSANLIDPYACKRIIEDLPKAMDKYGIENIKDIIGGVK